MVTAPKKILILRLSSIGDILLTSPLLRVLRQRFSGAEIDFVVKNQFEPLIRHNPRLNHIYSYEPRTGWHGLKEIKRAIRDREYDLVVDIHKNLRTVYLRHFSGAGLVVKSHKGLWRRFLLVAFGLNLYRSSPSIPLIYIRAVRAFGVEDDGLGLEFFIPQESRERAEVELIKGGLNPGDPLIGMAPGAGHPTKRWPKERFTWLGKRLIKDYHANLILFGNEKERGLCEWIAVAIGNSAMNLSGKLDLLETGALVEKCTLLVTNDNGIMHMAAALKKPVVALFGPTVEEFGFFPFRIRSVVLQKDLPCRPCSHLGSTRCPRGHFRCMADISAEEGLAAVRDIISLVDQNDNRKG